MSQYLNSVYIPANNVANVKRIRESSGLLIIVSVNFQNSRYSQCSVMSSHFMCNQH